MRGQSRDSATGADAISSLTLHPPHRSALLASVVIAASVASVSCHYPCVSHLPTEPMPFTHQVEWATVSHRHSSIGRPGPPHATMDSGKMTTTMSAFNVRSAPQTGFASRARGCDARGAS